MTDERINRMMSAAAKFYYCCPLPGLRWLPLKVCAAIAAKAIKKRHPQKRL